MENLNQEYSLAKIVKETLYIGSPIFLITALGVVKDFSVGVLLSKISFNTLVAAGLIIPTQLCLMTASQSCLYALSALVGQEHGKLTGLEYRRDLCPEQKRDQKLKAEEKIGSLLQHACLLGLMESLVISCLFYFSGTILATFSKQADSAVIAQKYFRVYFFAVPGVLLCTAIQQFLEAVGKRSLVFIVNLFGLLLGLSLSYAFSMGEWGAPRCGVQGVAIGLVARSYFQLSVYSLTLFYSSRFSKYKLKKLRIFKNFELFKLLLNKGAPISLQIAGELACLFVKSMLVGHLGVISLSAQTIVSHYLALFMSPIITLLQTANILVAKEYGMQKHSSNPNYRNIKKYGNVSILSGIILTLLILMITLIFNKEMIEFFLTSNNSDNGEIINLSSTLLTLCLVGQLFDAVEDISIGALRGLLDTFTPSMSSLFLKIFLGLPVSISLGLSTSLGVKGLSLGYVFTLFFTSFSLLDRWFKTNEKLCNPDLERNLGCIDGVLKSAKKLTTQPFALFFSSNGSRGASDLNDKFLNESEPSGISLTN